MAANELLVDRDWRITGAGAQARRLLGVKHLPLSDILGLRLWEIAPRLVGTDTESRLRETLSRGEPTELTWFQTNLATWISIRCEPAPRALCLRLEQIANPAIPECPRPAAAPTVHHHLVLETALALFPEPALVCSGLGRVAYANPAAESHFGRKPADLHGCNFAGLGLPPEAAVRLQQRLDLALAAGEGSAVEVEAPLSADGEGARFEYRFTPLRETADAPRLALVTGRRLSEPAPAASAQNRHDSLVGFATQLIGGRLTDALLFGALQRMARAAGAEIHLHHVASLPGPALRLVTTGGLAHEQLGSAANPVPGQGLCGLAAASEWPVVLEDVAHSDRPEAGELRAWGARAAVCHPLLSGGRLLGTLTFATTSRDRFSPAELEFARNTAGLLAAGLQARSTRREMENALTASRQAAQVKDEFFASLAHELRTPLNPALLVASHAAANAELPAAIRDDFALISKSIRLEARLIDDLLDLTRATHGKLSLELRPLSIHTVLLEALANVNVELEEKRLDLALHLAPVSPVVRGDPLRLQQVFWNILKNAVKFTPRGGAVSIRTGIDAGVARVEILDTGVGLTAIEIEHAFDSFAQGDHASGGASPLGGLGLGLAIARNLVELHSGHIRAVSEGRGCGACFIVELPVLPVEAAADLPPDPSPPLPLKLIPAKAASGPRLRILLVEDHCATREAFLKLLTHRDHEVIGAASVSEARTIALRKQFDLVISDLGLPDGSGFELMAGLHSDYGLTGVALTGQGTPSDWARARAVGFVAHLVKPVSIQTLEVALAEAASQRGREASRTIANESNGGGPPAGSTTLDGALANDHSARMRPTQPPPSAR